MGDNEQADALGCNATCYFSVIMLQRKVKRDELGGRQVMNLVVGNHRYFLCWMIAVFVSLLLRRVYYYFDSDTHILMLY